MVTSNLKSYPLHFQDPTKYADTHTFVVRNYYRIIHQTATTKHNDIFEKRRTSQQLLYVSFPCQTTLTLLERDRHCEKAARNTSVKTKSFSHRTDERATTPTTTSLSSPRQLYSFRCGFLVLPPRRIHATHHVSPFCCSPIPIVPKESFPNRD